jgi:hypothetical protein
MSGFLADTDIVTVAATSTVANVTLTTTGPSTFFVSNEGPATVLIGLTQGGTPIGNVALTADNGQIIQCPNPERVPGVLYAWVKTIGNLGTTANVFITGGFEV